MFSWLKYFLFLHSIGVNSYCFSSSSIGTFNSSNDSTSSSGSVYRIGSSVYIYASTFIIAVGGGGYICLSTISTSNLLI